MNRNGTNRQIKSESKALLKVQKSEEERRKKLNKEINKSVRRNSTNSEKLEKSGINKKLLTIFCSIFGIVFIALGLVSVYFFTHSYVVASVPARSEDNVDVLTDIVLTMSEEMNSETGNLELLILKDQDGNVVPFLLSEVNGREVKLSPAIHLDFNKDYKFILPKNFIKSENNHGNSKYTLKFETGDMPEGFDNLNPVVLQSMPMDGDTGVNPDNSMIIAFDEDISEGLNFGDIKCYDEAGNEVEIEVEIKDNKLVIKGDLKKNESYRLVIPKGAIKDSSKNPLDSDIVMEFATGLDETSPKVGISTPAPGMKDVDYNLKSVILEFNEEVISSNSGGISVSEVNGDIVSKGFSVSGNTVTVPVDLKDGKEYKITVSAGAVKDLSDNDCEAYSAHFTTKSIEVEKVEISPSTLTLTEGDSKILKAEITPKNATKPEVIWSSSNNNIVTVSNGTVKAINAGTATITAKAENGKQGTCIVSVYGNWSEWTTDSPPAGSYEVETKTQYRKRDEETYVTDWSSWGNEQSGDIAATETRYRQRDKEFTTSSSSSMSGWTLYQTDDHYGWSSWGATQGPIYYDPGNSDSRQSWSEIYTVSEGYNTAYYDYYRYNKSGASTSYFCLHVNGASGATKTTVRLTYPLSANGITYKCNVGCYPSSSKGYMYDGRLWFSSTGDNSPTYVWTEPVYGTRWYYQDRSWVIISHTYHYWRWGAWSNWKTGTGTANSDREVENQYRYKFNKTRWSSWSDWQNQEITANSKREVETRPIYRWRRKP